MLVFLGRCWWRVRRDVVVGRVWFDINWEGIGRVWSGRCCWKGWIRHQLEGNWKSWIRTLVMEGMLLLIVPIDVVIVDCSDRYCCWLFRKNCWKWINSGRRLEVLDPDVVDGRDVWFDVNWKGLIRTLLLEGTFDPDVVAVRGLEATSIGRVGSGCHCWKGWKGRWLEGLEETLIESRRRCWNGWIRTSIGRVGRDVGLEGTLDQNIVDGRVRSGRRWRKGWIRTSDWKGRWKGRRLEEDWKGRWIRTLLIVLIDAVVVDCSDWRCC